MAKPPVGTFIPLSPLGDAVVSDVRAGKKFSKLGEIDLEGTMPNRTGDTAAASSAISGTTLKLLATEGYRDGVDDYVTITDADFISANIVTGKNIFGLLGTGPIVEVETKSSLLVGSVWAVMLSSSWLPRAIIVTPTSGSRPCGFWLAAGLVGASEVTFWTIPAGTVYTTDVFGVTTGTFGIVIDTKYANATEYKIVLIG